MAIYVLHERLQGKNSEFVLWLNTLPFGQECIDTYPVCFTDADLKFLKGSSLIDNVNCLKADIRHDYNLICDKVPAMRKFTLNDFIQSMMMTFSHSFEIEMEGEPTKVFVPFVDLHKHSTYNFQVDAHYDGKS